MPCWPSLAETQPWKAAAERDYGWLAHGLAAQYAGDDSQLPALAAGILGAFADISVDDFAAQAAAFLRGTPHPTLGRGYLECAYAPMAHVPDDDGGTIVRKAAADYLDDGPEKPVRIWNRVGRRPVLAGGNSNGDIEMLDRTRHPSVPSLRLLVLHDDAEREFDHVAGSERALELAAAKGWTVVSVRNDWATVF